MTNVRRSNAVWMSTSLLAFGALMLDTAIADAATTTVTLEDGSTHKVEVADGLPKGVRNKHIVVDDLGISASFGPDQGDAPPFVRTLKANLKAKGQFKVTVTSLLDPAASETLSAAGPGNIVLRFFPQAKFPKVWANIDEPGVHWFPFHFVFEDQRTGRRFEFTQWAMLDDKTWKETRQMIEQAMRQLRAQ